MDKRIRYGLPILTAIGISLLSGCYYAIPTMMETVAQSRNLEESEGMALESQTGALKLFTPSVDNRQINDYIQGYNHIMVGQWSLMPSYYILTTKTMKSTSQDVIAYPVIRGLNKGIRFLKRGISYGIDESSELDSAIQQAIVAGEKLLADEKNSLPYFRNQVYRRDDMNGAKMVLPVIKADYDQLIAAMNQIGSLLLQVQQSESARLIGIYASHPNHPRYFAERALQTTWYLMDFLNKNQAYRRPNSYLQADQFVNRLKRELNQLKTTYTQQGREWTDDRGFGGMHTQLSQLIELYDTLKQSRRSVVYNRMMRRYSDAVLYYNSVIRLKQF